MKLIIRFLYCSTILVYTSTFADNEKDSQVLIDFFNGIDHSHERVYEGIDLFKDIKIEGIANIALLVDYLREDPVILEAGGHEGEDTIKFASLWPMGNILSFEPNPRAYEVLLDQCQGCPNVNAFNLALDSTEGTKPFYLCQGPDHSSEKEGGSSLLPSSPYMTHHYQGDIIDVECVVLDKWCVKEGVNYIDLIWFDLEGKELDVLSGGEKILKNTKFIYTETNLQEFRVNGCTFKELRSFLEKHGFVLVAHWYIKDWQGDALFVKGEYFNTIQPNLIGD